MTYIATTAEKLDVVLKSISVDNAESLKRELLIGIVPASENDMMSSGFFFGQKPVSFDPLTGSITAPSLFFHYFTASSLQKYSKYKLKLYVNRLKRLA